MFQISDYFDSTLLDNFTSKNIFCKRWLIMFIHISYMLAPYSNTTLGFYVMDSLKRRVKNLK